MFIQCMYRLSAINDFLIRLRNIILLNIIYIYANENNEYSIFDNRV